MTSHALIPRKSTEIGLIDRMPTQGMRIVPPVAVKGTVIWMCLIGFGLFGILAAWAAVAPMQSSVVASGVFRVIGDRLVVQHLEGGIVRSIDVKEGDVVREGQVLLTLDATSAQAAVDILTNQLVSALSKQARLEAEYTATDQIQVSAELAILLEANPSYAQMFKTQVDVFATNARINQGQIDILQERIRQLDEQKRGIDVRLTAQTQQLALIRDAITTRSALLEQQLITKSEMLNLRSDEAGLVGNVGVTQSQLQSTLQQIAEVEARKLQIRQDNLKEITEGRQQANEQVFDLYQRLAAAQDTLRRLTIEAPRAGRIMDLKVNTLGSVIAAGQQLMDLVPTDAGYVIEVRVSPNDINQVAEGGPARVRLTAYNYRTTPMIDGRVTAVSADSLVDQVTGAPYFLANVQLYEDDLRALKDVKVVPGMPAQVMIATGEQTLANYLLSPVLGGYERALIENE